MVLSFHTTYSNSKEFSFSFVFFGFFLAREPRRRNVEFVIGKAFNCVVAETRGNCQPHISKLHHRSAFTGKLTWKCRKHRHSPASTLPSSLAPSSSPPPLLPSLRVPHKFAGNQRSPKSHPCIRAIDLDQNTVVAISVGFASVAVGIGIPVFYETQIDSAAKRDNTQPCFPCNGTGAQKCRFCTGSGTVTVGLGGGEKEVSNCINCEGVGSFTCTTCQGSGIQPRYLDRREFKDDD